MKVYNLLISCPSDVQDYESIIQGCVEVFNRNYGEINNTLILIKHWKSDSFPESGDKPQALLNKQFVLDSDAAVALFWTKFGTPTNTYGSGTEEEIEELLKQGKQIFMYFLKSPVSLDEVDMEQYQKVKEFQEKYKDRGIYVTINDREEFQRQFTNHLASYFMPLVSGVPISSTDSSNIVIEDAILSEQVALAQKTNLINTVFIKDQIEKCKKKIISINKMILPEEIIKGENPSDNENIPQKLGMIDTDSIFGKSEIVKINETWKAIIEQLVATLDLKINDSFFDIGSLRRRESYQYKIIGGARYDYLGSTLEEEKFNAIKSLYLDAKKLQAYQKYFSEIDNFRFVSLGVLNDGKTFDEDIDITLYFEKNTIVYPRSFPIPEESIIEEVDQEIVEYLLGLDSHEKTIPFDNYPDSTTRYIPPTMDLFQYTKSYDDFESEYLNEIEEMMCYEIFEKEDIDILQFKINYLKQHTKMLFPSRLYLKKVNTTIKYEITSKYSPEVLKGELEIKV